MSEHRNFIAGEWVAGVRTHPNVNPSDTRDVVGEYALADAAQARTATDHFGNAACAASIRPA